MKKRIAPSLLSADFSELQKEVSDIEISGADWLHLDVMDGVFVPNISFGLPVIRSLRRVSGLFFDVHLMIVHPENYLRDFAQAGADLITFHYEATEDPACLLREIRSLGKKAGISIKPGTSPDVLLPLLPLCDVVLIMSVEPGFGGQSFLPSALDKIRLLAGLKNEKVSFLTEVDGGIHTGNAGEIFSAGADMLVAGTAVFGAPDRQKAIAALKGE